MRVCVRVCVSRRSRDDSVGGGGGGVRGMPDASFGRPSRHGVWAVGLNTACESFMHTLASDDTVI